MAIEHKRTYAEKLKDPRWQRKRLEILARDNWKCVKCGNTEATLHVHHWWYERGGEPWDSPAEALSAICEYCHGYETECRSVNEQKLLRFMQLNRWSAVEVEMLFDVVSKGLPQREIPNETEDGMSDLFAALVELSSPRVVQNVIDTFRQRQQPSKD